MINKQSSYSLITGATHTDARGKLDHINNLDLSSVKRFYKITPADTEIVRAWQVHKIESKWFHCVKGSFEVKIVNLEIRELSTFILDSTEMEVLYIPRNHANGFRALEEDSTLQVFSDKTLEESLLDGGTEVIGFFNEVW